MVKFKYTLLTDGSDLEGVENTYDLRYMQLLRYHMRIICGWPRKEKIRIIPFILERHALLTTVSVSLPLLHYVIEHTGKLPLTQMSHIYITYLMNIVSISRLAVTAFSPKYKQFTFDFMDKYHVFHMRHDSDYAMKIHYLVHKMSNFFTTYLVCMMCCGMTLFNLMPIFNNVMAGAFDSTAVNVTYEHSIYFTMPFNYESNLYGYVVMVIVNYYLSYNCTTSFCMLDAYLTIMTLHLWGHLKILINNLETFPRPKNEYSFGQPSASAWYTDEEQYEVTHNLKNILTHHKVILEKEISTTFGEILVVYFAFYQVVCCLLLLQCSIMDIEALSKFGLLTFFFYEQLIVTSIIFEHIGTVGDKIAISVYNLPWQFMNTNNRKIIWIFLRKSQEPLNIKAANMLEIGVQTMAAILKTSLSYFIMLKTIAANDKNK